MKEAGLKLALEVASADAAAQIDDFIGKLTRGLAEINTGVEGFQRTFKQSFENIAEQGRKAMREVGDAMEEAGTKLNQRFKDFSEFHQVLEKDGEAVQKFLDASNELFQQRSYGDLLKGLSPEIGTAFETAQKGMKGAADAANEWLGKVNRFGATVKDASESVARALGTEVNGKVLLVTGSLVALDGVTGGLVGSVNQLRGAYALLTGQELVSMITGLQTVTKLQVITAVSTNSLATSVATLKTVFTSLAGVIAVVAAAFAGWQIGTFLGEMDLKLGNVNLKLKEWTQLASVEFLKGVEKIKAALGMISDDELKRRLDNYEKTSRELQGLGEGGNKTDKSGANGSGPAAAPAGPSRQEQHEAMLGHAQAYNESMLTAEAKLAQAGRDAEAAHNEEEYRAGLISFQEYLAKKRKLAEEQFDAVQKPLAKQLDEVYSRLNAMPQKGFVLGSQSNQELEELLRQKEELQAELGVLGKRLNQDKAALETEAAAQQKQVFDDLDQRLMASSTSKLEQLEQQRRVEEVNLQQKLQDETMFLQAKAQLDEIYGQRRREIVAGQEREDQQLKFAELEAERKLAESDPTLDKATRKQRLLDLFQKEIELTDELIKKNEGLLESEGTSDEERLRVRKELVGLKEREAELQRQKSKTGEDGQEQAGKNAKQQPGFKDTLRNNLQELSDRWGNVQGNVANWLTNSFQTAVDGVSNSIMGLIDGTKTWGDVFADVGRSILANLIKLVVQMIAQMLIIKPLMKLMGLENTQMATQSATAWAPAAVAASIASYGAASGVGLAAAMGAMTIGAAFGAALSGIGGMAGYEQGGFTGEGRADEVAGLVHRGEFVFPAPAVRQIGLPRLSGLMNGLGELSPRIAGMGAMGGHGFRSSTPNVNVAPAPVKVVVVNSQEELMKVMKGSVGEEITVAHIAKNKLRLGMAS